MRNKTLLFTATTLLFVGNPVIHAMPKDKYTKEFPSLEKAEELKAQKAEERKRALEERRQRKSVRPPYQQGEATNLNELIKNKQKSKKPIVQQQDSWFYKFYTGVLYGGDRTEKSLAILDKQEIPAEWTKQSRNTVGWGIKDLNEAMSNEDEQHDLDTLRGLQDTLDANQPRLEKFQKIIELISQPRVRAAEGEELTLLRMDDEELANADTTLIANMEQQLKFYEFVTRLICTRLAQSHETRTLIRQLKLTKEELAGLPNNDYSNFETTFNAMCQLAEQQENQE